MGPKRTRIRSYKGHLQKKHFSHPKGKKRSLIIHSYKSTSHLALSAGLLKFPNFSTVSLSQKLQSSFASFGSKKKKVINDPKIAPHLRGQKDKIDLQKEGDRERF